jgi:integrase
VIEPSGKQRSFALRFHAYGKRRYVRLGRPEEGWTLSKAETELRHVLADVERGLWTPRTKAKEPVAREAPTFHLFASEWLAGKEAELSPRTLDDYRWALVNHLLPFFKDHLLTEITIEEVDRYKNEKARRGDLSNNSINSTLTKLSMVMEMAAEYGHVPSNPASGRRRRLKRDKPKANHLEPEQLPAFLEASEELLGPGGEPSEYRPIARPLLEVLSLAGLRIGEAMSLTWADVSLSSLTLKVRESKTEAGIREVVMVPRLAETLVNLRADRGVESGHLVFGSVMNEGDSPRPLDRQRVRQRIFLPAIEQANERLEELGIEPIGRATPHGLRKTYASLRFACGDDPVWVAQQLGHSDPRFSIKVYARSVKRRERLTGETLKAFEKALSWAELGRTMAGSSIEEALEPGRHSGFLAS